VAEPTAPTSDHPGPSRRRVLGALGGGLVLGSALGAGGASWLTDDPSPARAADPTDDAGSGRGTGQSGGGEHQNGIDVPATPQAHGLVLCNDLPVLDGPAGGHLVGVSAALAAVQQAVEAVVQDPGVSPDGPAGLTVTVGLGPRAVRAVSPDLPGATPLPTFDRDDQVRPGDRGGDLLLAVHADDPGVVGRAATQLAAQLPQVSPRWQQRGYRGAGDGTINRNPLGHLDGVIVPRGDREMAENVWIGDGAAAGGTICVIRRLRLDVPAFTALSETEQDRTIGRRRRDGVPLSGGGPRDQIDLTAKTADGQYRVPMRSHARAAHPSFTGSALMLRRGYMFDNGAHDEGLLFVCFQRDLDTFVKTQRRLDEQDDLMQYATPTASATFLVLPGFGTDRPLGASLLAAARP
jgi:deferrochelatase/peroxidase EfeB